MHYCLKSRRFYILLGALSKLMFSHSRREIQRIFNMAFAWMIYIRRMKKRIYRKYKSTFWGSFSFILNRGISRKKEDHSRDIKSICVNDNKNASGSIISMKFNLQKKIIPKLHS